MQLIMQSIKSWVSALSDRRLALTPFDVSLLQALLRGSESPVTLEQYLSESIATVYTSLTKLERLGLVRSIWVKHPEHPVTSNLYRQRQYEITQRGMRSVAHNLPSKRDLLLAQITTVSDPEMTPEVTH
jgi:DNA-binding PadR family transcriptional regulator